MQGRQEILDNLPDSRVIDSVLAMDKTIAEADDRSIVGDAPGGRWVGSFETKQRFTHDFEVALDGLAQKLICGVVGRRYAYS